ncbi:ATP F0F1 synthase subunit B [Aestuariivirga sp.]|uniref:F0F1 ATP synthase subunit B family protein n=1 Tax=Aestuariivirga sp. TaxID=2650926 RepID=UPI00391C22CA
MHFDATFFALVALIIFFGIVIYAGGFKAMGSGLDARAERIARELEHAAQLRKEAEALLAEYRQKRLDAEKEAASIVAAARADAEEYAAETRRKLAESLDRRTRQAEQKIAQAEAAAIKDVRNAATDLAIAAARNLMSDTARSPEGAELIASSIDAVKNRLN